MKVSLLSKLITIAALSAGLAGAQTDLTDVATTELSTSTAVEEAASSSTIEAAITETSSSTKTTTTNPPESVTSATETAVSITSASGTTILSLSSGATTVTSSFTGSRGNSTASSASATSSVDANDEVTEIDPLSGTESTKPIPPDVTTPEQHAAEEQQNRPETRISDADAKEIAVMETVLFEYYVQNSPAPVDVGKLTIPTNVSDCSVQKRSILGSQGLGHMLPRSLRGWNACKFVTSLEFDVYFHYIRELRDAERPLRLQARIQENMALLKQVYGPLGITFNFKSYQGWQPPATGTNKDWSLMKKNEARLQRWQRQTHTAGKMSLTVWLVNEIQSANGQLNGYATFPEDNKGQLDGVVMDQSRIFGSGSATLIHEIGHWLGLQHTFGTVVKDKKQDCKMGDGLLDTTLTPGFKDEVFECSQVPCAGGAAREINYWMSYSRCRGKVVADGFTTDQKAAIFSRVLKYRRGYRAGECSAADPAKSGNPVKRSSMQDLVDGKCPDINAQVSAIKSVPTKAPDAKSGASRLVVTLGALSGILAMFWLL